MNSRGVINKSENGKYGMISWWFPSTKTSPLPGGTGDIPEPEPWPGGHGRAHFTDEETEA